MSDIVTYKNAAGTEVASIDADGAASFASTLDVTGVLTPGALLLAGATAKTADYTIPAASTGMIWTNRGASGAVDFTLPAPTDGWWGIFCGFADQNLGIVGATAGDLVTLDNAAADSATASTASEKIGAVAIVVSDGTSHFVLPVVGTWTVA